MASPVRHRHRSRMTAVLSAAISGTVLTGAFLLPGSAAQAEPATSPALKDPAAAAATWAASQLADGTHASGPFADDPGLTADIILGIAATGTGTKTAGKATDWLAANSRTYIERDGKDMVFAGAAAKVALVAAVEHRDPKNFGGQNLVKLLLDNMKPSGRFSDKSASGDGSNQFTQTLAILALQKTGDLPPVAVDYLAASRCTTGGFPLYPKVPATCTKGHTDSTGLAVQALISAGRTAEAKPALEWLESIQKPDGSFPDNGFGDPPGNANSTALVVQALAAGGHKAAADKGIAWLRSVQVGCEGAAADRGAVGYDKPVADDNSLRATAQVIPALAGKSLADVDGKSGTPDLAVIDCSVPKPDPKPDPSQTSSSAAPSKKPSTTPETSTSASASVQPSTSVSATSSEAAVAPKPAPPVTNAKGGGGGGLASTGATGVLTLAGGAALLLLIGALAVVASRRRNART